MNFRKPVAPRFIDIRLAASVYLVRKPQKSHVATWLMQLLGEMCAFSERFHLQYYYLRVTYTERCRILFGLCAHVCVSALEL